jgi:hypothetical protein
LLAAALGACAFLPVFYGHAALNDVPATLPATLALLATAFVLRGGGVRVLLLGGVATGLAAGTKYTAGIVLLPLLTALLVRAREEYVASTRTAPTGSAATRAVSTRTALMRLAVAAGIVLAAAAAGFFLANPYAFLDFGAFHAGIAQQREYASGRELAKLGLTQHNGVLYYLWTLTWGLGWVPALAALGGAIGLLARDRRLALVLLPAPLLFLLFMGTQERYFGRWLLPILPIAILLAASFGVELVRAVAVRIPRLVLPAAVVVVLALVGQGLACSLHVDHVLARPDTRNDLRAWMLTHVPAGARVVIEPVVPSSWLQDPDRAAPATPSGARWRTWDTTRADVDDRARPLPNGGTRYVKVDRYERTLRPVLLDDYVARGFCWVVIGSTQYGRAFAEPGEVPGAIAYYRALAQRGEERLRLRPYGDGSAPPRFNFDWSFDFYPRAYARPGPELVVYRLRGGTCG